VTSALITATALGIAGLGYCTVLGFIATSSHDIFLHASFGIFFTLIILLAHSMTMFYLIGKGKAVREAVTEGGLSHEFYTTVARLRRPVFSIATIAMVLTMTTSIAGGGVDTQMIPTGIHLALALSAIVVNLMALRTEVLAMLACARIVGEVNNLLKD